MQFGFATEGMLGRREGNLQYFSTARDAHRNGVAGGEEKFGVERVFGFADDDVAHLDHDVAGAEILRGRTGRIDQIDGHARAFDRDGNLLQSHAGPTVPHFPETRVVAADFFGRANGNDIATRAVLQSADQHADHAAVEIEHRAAALSALHRNVGAEMRRGEKFAARLAVESSDHAEARRDLEIIGKSDDDERGGGFDFAAITFEQEGLGVLGLDFEQCDADAVVLGQQTRGQASVAVRDEDARAIADHGGKSEDGAVRIDKKSRAGHLAQFVLALDADHRRRGGLKDTRNGGFDRVGDFRTLGGLRRPRRFVTGQGHLRRTAQCGTKTKSYKATHSSRDASPARSAGASRTAGTQASGHLPEPMATWSPWGY